MSKFFYTEDFRIRMTNAAKNGSNVCAAIMKAINTDDNVREGVRFNYLTTKRVRHGSNENFIKKSIVVTACNKDFTNSNNPEHGSPVGMWRPENRTNISLNDLVGAFKSLEGNDFTSADYQYAASILAVDEPMKVGIYSKMKDIARGYLGDNYIEVFSGDGSLQNSCMRHDDTAAVAADFYANFAGAKIILVTGTVSGKVYGRAMLWPNIELLDPDTMQLVSGSFLERVYYAHDAIMIMVRNFAKEHGVRFRKYKNTYSDKKTFIDMQNGDKLIESQCFVKVPANKWHKFGSPYLDTFSFLFYEDGEFYLGNLSRKNGCTYVADLACTGTTACINKYICPVCGRVHGVGDKLCSDCRETYTKETIVGTVWIGKMDKKHNPILNKKFARDAERLSTL